MTSKFQFEEDFVILSDFLTHKAFSEESLHRFFSKCRPCIEVDKWLKSNKINAEYSIKFANIKKQRHTDNSLTYHYEILPVTKYDAAYQRLYAVYCLHIRDKSHYVLFKLVWG